VPDQVEVPTPGAEEAIGRAWLGVCSDASTQTHWLCLAEVEVVAFRPPTERRSP
jgi:hypothetical protein